MKNMASTFWLCGTMSLTAVGCGTGLDQLDERSGSSSQNDSMTASLTDPASIPACAIVDGGTQPCADAMSHTFWSHTVSLLPGGASACRLDYPVCEGKTFYGAFSLLDSSGSGKQYRDRNDEYDITVRDAASGSIISMPANMAYPAPAVGNGFDGVVGGSSWIIEVTRKDGKRGRAIDLPLYGWYASH